ncbi:MAG: hypothetical protein HKN03_15975 [Acidimicrobiales bacterium]|nr:hypothetical protein [Acidimicrobiales bacterium]
MSALTAATAAQTAAQAVSAAAQAKKRRALHAYLSDAAHDTWHQFAAKNGVTVSAALEALAAELHDRDPADGGIDFAPIIERARKTDASRRRRRS